MKSTALARSEARFRDLADITPTLIWQCDVQLELTYTNRHWREHMGHGSSETTGQDFLHFIHSDDVKTLEKEMALAVAEQRHISCELRMETQQGVHRWVKCCMAVHQSDDGDILSYLGTGIDITDLKDTQNRLQISNKDLEEFAYVASHDLKSPLRGIEHLAQWISEDEDTHLSEKSNADLELLKEKARSLHRLLDSLLAYSRLRKIEGEVGEVDLKQMVNQVMNLVTEDRSFTVCYGDCVQTLFVKITPIKLILQNLISNAVKHHDKKTGVITISCTENDQFYLCSVADDGPGIPINQREKVFKLFQRLDNEGSDGSGMGLAIVKRLVERDGGNISIEDSSTGKRGVEFRFSISKAISE